MPSLPSSPRYTSCAIEAWFSCKWGGWICLSAAPSLKLVISVLFLTAGCKQFFVNQILPGKPGSPFIPGGPGGPGGPATPEKNRIICRSRHRTFNNTIQEIESSFQNLQKVDSGWGMFLHVYDFGVAHALVYIICCFWWCFPSTLKWKNKKEENKNCRDGETEQPHHTECQTKLHRTTSQVISRWEHLPEFQPQAVVPCGSIGSLGQTDPTPIVNRVCCQGTNKNLQISWS